MTNRRITRRTTLKGLGAVTVGLPFLEEMAFAAPGKKTAAPPVRTFNVFFGLGIPSPLHTEGFDGVFEPLKPLAKKLLIMQNVDQVRWGFAGGRGCDSPSLSREWMRLE